VKVQGQELQVLLEASPRAMAMSLWVEVGELFLQTVMKSTTPFLPLIQSPHL
jgi:hypothetical protein